MLAEGGMVNIKEFQEALLMAKLRAFGDHQAPTIRDPHARMFNLTEEVGELAREMRFFKETGEIDVEKAKDAVGDIFIVLVGYCIAMGWDADEVITEIWESVQERWGSGKLRGDR